MSESIIPAFALIRLNKTRPKISLITQFYRHGGKFLFFIYSSYQIENF